MSDDTNGHGIPVTAMLLYRKPDTAIATTYLHALNEACEPLGERFSFAEDGDDACWVLDGGSARVVVEAPGEAAPQERFERSLQHPFLDAVFPAGKAIVKGHRDHVRITVVGAGVDTAEIGEPGPRDLEPEAMLPRLRLLRAATQAYTAQRFPLAVHWGQCDNLLAGPDFVQMAERGAETELFVTAVPYSSQAETGAAYGAVTNGAVNVIGREVELAEAPVAPAWAADRLLQFVEKARSGVPNAGEALRFPTDEILLVHEAEATSECPDGHLRLTVEKLPNGVTIAPQADAAMGFLAEMDGRGAARAFGRR